MTEKHRHFWLMSSVFFTVLGFLACGGSDDSDNDGPNPPTPAVENVGEVSFSITNVSGSGSGTASDPIVAQSGDTLSMAITQKSSYTDPDGKVFTCEPKAVVKIFTPGDTLYVKDLKTLLAVSEQSNKQSQSAGTNMKTIQRQQKFSVGGQEVTFDLSHDIYTFINSQNTSVEMPYVKLGAAKYGAAQTSEAETRGIAAAVATIRLTPLTDFTRGGTITESTAYAVDVSFTIDIESVNTKSANPQTLSFDVNFVGVVETTTEIPDPTTDISYELSHKSGTTSTVSPYSVTIGEPFSLEWQQTVTYQYYDVDDRAIMQVKYEPKAYVHIDAIKADTIWVTDISELEKATKSKPVINSTGDNPIENTGSLAFTVAGRDVSLNWGYHSYNPLKVEGADVNLPYLALTAPQISNVKVVEVPNGVLVGKKGKLYNLTVTVNQNLETVNTSEAKSEPLQYVITFIAAIAVEEPKLVAIKYRKGYQWFDPHDNIPLTYQYIVYRDSVFSDGSVHTSETRSANTTMEWGFDFSSSHLSYGQEVEQVVYSTDEFINQVRVPVYYFAVQGEIDFEYRNGKATRKIAVPDISVVTAEENLAEPDVSYPYQWGYYPGYNPSAPQMGWYWSDFHYQNYVKVCNNFAAGGGVLTLFDISSRWYNHIFYVEDDLNGGQLISFLGDESDIDDVDFRPQFDFKLTEETTTMPTGEPAKVFKHTCVTTMLGRQFHYELVDSVYQYSEPPY